MAEQINWTLNVQAVGGPKISASNALAVDGYDKIEAEVIADPNTPKTVEVQPSGSVAQLLLITASSYGSLTYKVDPVAFPQGPVVKLDSPHLFIGDGALSLLLTPPNIFEFTNASGQNVTVSILVGRDFSP